MTDLKEWLEHMAEERSRLYDQYGKPFEEHHKGEYLAIGFGGETILGKRCGEVLNLKTTTAFIPLARAAGLQPRMW